MKIISELHAFDYLQYNSSYQHNTFSPGAIQIDAVLRGFFEVCFYKFDYPIPFFIHTRYPQV